MDALVSCEWLAATKASVRLLHVSHDGGADYAAAHIDGALLFDGKACVDRASSFPNTLPTPSQFQAYASESLGISAGVKVVLYDTFDPPSLYWSCRVWTIFRVFGHDNVSVLNGGLKKWTALGFPTTTTPALKPAFVEFKAQYQPQLVKTFEQVVADIKNGASQYADARPAERFSGKRPDLDAPGKCGHAKGAISVPASKLFCAERQQLRGADELRQVLAEAGVDLARPLTCACNSGMSANAIILAAFLCGKKDAALFDGSWSEFRQRADDSLIEKDT